MKKIDILDMPLGDRMKFYEAAYESTVEPEKHIVIRIDGHKFSKYTKGFKKPFDAILSKAMELTTLDLVQEYQAVTGYTQSDEITLVIPSLMNTERHKGTNKPLWEHQFGGRVQKMVGLIAGFTTMRFNKHLEGLILYESSTITSYTDEEDFKYQSFLETKIGNAYFDCRIYGIPDEAEVYNSVMWRVRDAEKNSRSMFAQAYCSHRELQKKTGLEQVAYCLEKTGKDWDEVEDRYKYGILVKKETYLKEPTPPSDLPIGAEVLSLPVERTRVISFTEKLTTFSDENVDLVMRAVK